MPVFLSRRELLIAAAGAASLTAKENPAAPNIVLITADDVGAWMLGCYGNRDIRTPNLDLLARSGTRFSGHYVSTPTGSPSRATLFTGRVPAQHGILDYLTANPVANPPQGQAAPPPSFASEVMISDLLAARGYNCGFSGKWGMGGDTSPQHGFKSWYTMPAPTGSYRDPKMSRSGEIVQEHGYLADLITQNALRFLDSQKQGQPFFLVVSHYNIHSPYDEHPAKYYEMYAKAGFEGIGWEKAAPNALRDREALADILGSLRKSAAAATALDDQIPPIIGKLDQLGIRDNTLVVFTAANGSLLGRHGLWGSGHASDPINMYEEVVATPMIWNWPGKVPPQAVRPELVSTYDVLPTLCEVAGAAAPDRNLPGRSYLPAALGRQFPKKQPWRMDVFSQLRTVAMARDSRYKLVLRNQGKGPNEFYDLKADAREDVNRYDNPAFVSMRDLLTGKLRNWQKKYGA
jgi:choline-sulfatase